jgi:hypothetical protein
MITFADPMISDFNYGMVEAIMQHNPVSQATRKISVSGRQWALDTA